MYTSEVKERERKEKTSAFDLSCWIICPLVSWSVATWIERKMVNQSKCFCDTGMLCNGNESDSLFLSFKWIDILQIDSRVDIIGISVYEC